MPSASRTGNISDKTDAVLEIKFHSREFNNNKKFSSQRKKLMFRSASMLSSASQRSIAFANFPFVNVNFAFARAL